MKKQHFLFIFFSIFLFSSSRKPFHSLTESLSNQKIRFQELSCNNFKNFSGVSQKSFNKTEIIKIKDFINCNSSPENTCQQPEINENLGYFFTTQNVNISEAFNIYSIKGRRSEHNYNSFYFFDESRNEVLLFNDGIIDGSGQHQGNWNILHLSRGEFARNILFLLLENKELSRELKCNISHLAHWALKNEVSDMEIKYNEFLYDKWKIYNPLVVLYEEDAELYEEFIQNIHKCFIRTVGTVAKRGNLLQNMSPKNEELKKPLQFIPEIDTVVESIGILTRLVTYIEKGVLTRVITVFFLAFCLSIVNEITVNEIKVLFKKIAEIPLFLFEKKFESCKKKYELSSGVVITYVSYFVKVGLNFVVCIKTNFNVFEFLVVEDLGTFRSDSLVLKVFSALFLSSGHVNYIFKICSELMKKEKKNEKKNLT